MNLLPVSKTYDGVTVLDFPGISLEPGKIYGVIGSNGSGKSTFSKILAGIFPADQKAAPLERGISVGYMPQKNYAFRMSTRANVLLGGREESRADEWMKALQIDHLANKRADRLSGGETARMALARLMMKSFDLVILDEPTAAMDMETTVLAERMIVNYVQRTGCALILVTHSLQQARRISDEILYFYHGKLAETGPISCLEAPKTAELQQFLEFYGV